MRADSAVRTAAGRGLRSRQTGRIRGIERPVRAGHRVRRKPRLPAKGGKASGALRQCGDPSRLGTARSSPGGRSRRHRHRRHGRLSHHRHSARLYGRGETDSRRAERRLSAPHVLVGDGVPYQRGLYGRGQRQFYDVIGAERGRCRPDEMQKKFGVFYKRPIPLCWRDAGSISPGWQGRPTT